MNQFPNMFSPAKTQNHQPTYNGSLLFVAELFQTMPYWRGQHCTIHKSMRIISVRSVNSFCVVAILYHATFRQPPGQPIVHNNKNVDNDPVERMNHFPFQEELEARKLHLSLRQQKKFHMRKNDILAAATNNVSNKGLMFTLDWNTWHSFLLNDRFAFRHIFKNGGTTVENQIGARQVRKEKVGNRTIMAVVRDPLDHFLSGWQECGERSPGYMEWKKRSDSEYDGRIRKWLERCQILARGESYPEATAMQRMCALHSMPQTNFLIANDSRVDPNILLVGDLQELPKLLQVAGVDYNHSILVGKNSLFSTLKTTYFPKKLHLIANDTMRSICDFLSLDYFLFDFELPEPCKTKALV